MSKETKKIVVDSGKFATKAVLIKPDGKLKKLTFRTKMSETEETLVNTNETYAVHFNGGNYLVGRQATNSDWETSKSSNLHQLSIYTSIHQFVNDGDSVDLIVGCPLSVYTKRKQREEYEQIMKGDGDITITVNEEKKTFRIDSIHAIPETSGYLFKHAINYENKLFAVVDVGGLNANCCQYMDGDILHGTDITLNMGMNTLYKNIQNSLNKEFSSNISLIQVEQIMKMPKENREIKKDKENSKKLIHKLTRQHVEGLKDACIQNGWDVDNIEFIFVGGGSKALSEEVRYVFGDDVIISDNAVWDNAEGFAELLK